jgi:cation:H+ antiporter
MVLVSLIWVGFKFWRLEAPPLVIAWLTGMAIVAAAFLLCWAAEAAQKDVSQTLAIAFLALIAVLPEYAVDLYFAWMAGKNPTYVSYATANMTGGNRLLIGCGWSLIVFLWWIVKKKTKIEIKPSYKIELSLLCLATLYSFIIPLKGTLSLLDTLVLISGFIFYMILASRAKVIEPELTGPAEFIGLLSQNKRRVLVIFLFLYAGFIIFISAKPFAEALIQTGKIFGIEEFILVQWVAPLASESPEIIAASLFVFKAKPSVGLGTLISSKINQWTLLVGMLPLIFSISAFDFEPMVLDQRQAQEIFLTSAQSLFAVVLLAHLTLSLTSALALFCLFFTQLIFPSSLIRLTYAVLYLILSIGIIFKDYLRLKSLISSVSSLFVSRDSPKHL